MKTKILGIMLAILMVSVIFTLSSCFISPSGGKCEHEYGDWHTVVPPSCNSSGEEIRYCQLCDEYEKSNLPKKDHEPVIDKKIEPDCENPGLTEGSHCYHCRKILTEQKTIPALGHNWSDPDCTNAKHCSTCGKTSGEALGHTEEALEAVNATCTEAGLTAGLRCSDCGEILISQEIIPALEHNWIDATCTDAKTCEICGEAVGEALGHTWKDATCTDAKTCEICGEAVGEALGHTWKDATCTDAKTCEICGDTDGDALGHTEVVDAEVSPTCTESGLTKGYHCSVCDKILVAQKVVNALGHSWKDATCTEAKTCKICGDTDGDALGHTEVVDEKVFPTCTESGVTEGSHCSACGKVFIEQKVVPAIGHRLEKVEALNPTCTRAGYTAHQECASCDYETPWSVIAPIGHDFTYTTTESTCTTSGVKITTCERCDYEEFGKILPLGHDEIYHEGKEPNCQETGWIDYVTCSRCDYTTYTELPITDHSMSDWYGNTADCTHSGYEYSKCHTCEHTKKRRTPLEDHTFVNGACSMCGATEGLAYTWKSLKVNNISYTGWCVTGLGQSTASKIVIPEFYEKQPVYFIGESAFKNKSNITSLTIPSVVYIGKYAFYGCTYLTEVNYNAFSVADFGANNYVFYNAGTKGDGITFTISDNVRYIPSYFFRPYGTGTENSYAPKIKNLIFEKISGLMGMKSPDSFYGSVEITNLYIDSLEDWLSFEFMYSSNPLTHAKNFYVDGELLTELVIPDTVTTVPTYAFYGFDSLTKVTIPSHVTSIGDHAFDVCSNLNEVIVENGVTSIGDYSFARTAISEVTVPDSVTHIYDGAFKDCKSLCAINIGKGLQYLGSSVFDGCTLFKEIHINDLSAWCSLECYGELLPTSSSLNKIEYDLYLGDELIRDLVIPEGVDHINNGVFWNCKSIVSLTVPDSVVSIGERAFADCENLTSVEIADSVAEIGWGAFYGCNNVVSITLPFIGANNKADNTNTHLGYIFGSDYQDNNKKVPSKLKTVIINGDTEFIGNRAFYNCGNITEIILPSSLTSISNEAFYDCSSLETIAIPGGVTKIGGNAFYGCTAIDGVYIEDLTAWFGITFDNEYSNPLYSGKLLYLEGELVVDLEVPESVTEIKAYAFHGCMSIVNVTLHENLKKIYSYAFEDCMKLNSVVNLSELNIVAGSTDNGYVAYYAERVSSTPQEVVNLDGFIFIKGWPYLLSYIGEDTNVVLPESFNDNGYNICSYAFYDCDFIKSLVIPKNVSRIEKSAIYGCDGLENISLPFVGESNTSELSHFGYIFGAANYSENPSYVPASLKSVTVTRMSHIRENDFYRCSKITSIALDEMSRLDKSAFYGCSSLEKLAIPLADVPYLGYLFGASKYTYNSTYVPTTLKSVTVLYGEIGDYMFYDCSGITDINISEKVYGCIGTYAFGECTSLTSINLPYEITSIENFAFYNCKKLTNVYFDASIFAVDEHNYIFYNAGKNGNGIDLIIGKNVTSIPAYMFACTTTTNEYTPKIISLTFEEESACTYIGYHAFYRVSALKNVTFREGLREIGSHAFYQCASLTAINIPASVESIGDYAFYGCSKATELTFANDSKITHIRQGTFAYLNTITEVVLPQGVKSVGLKAFYHCTSLDSIYMGTGITDIYDYAFEESQLSYVFYSGENSNWESINITENNAMIKNAHLITNVAIENSSITE